MESSQLTSLSIFVPAFNEARNIEETIQDALQYAPQVAKRYEVIVIDDGSRDETGEIAARYAAGNPHVRLITHSENRGYGAAVKSGIKAAKYDWIFFTDSDRQFHFSELPRFVSLHPKADIIVGRRLKRRDPIIRIIIAQIMLKYWNLLLFGLSMKDVDCAYKLIPTELIRQIQLNTESAITVTELMVKLKRQGARIYETPVTHYPRRHGKQTGSHPKVILRALRESFNLWKELQNSR